MRGRFCWTWKFLRRLAARESPRAAPSVPREVSRQTVLAEQEDTAAASADAPDIGDARATGRASSTHAAGSGG